MASPKLAVFIGTAMLMLTGSYAAGHGGGQTCTPAADVEVSIPSYQPMEPAVTGMMPGSTKARVILGQDVDWPPYAFFGDSSLELEGFPADIAKGLSTVCPNLEVTMIQLGWAECWGNGMIGMGLRQGDYSGCVAYTHTVGARNRYLEFSSPILNDHNAAGIITRLDANLQPAVDGKSDLSTVKMIDINGWAPTADGLAVTTNPCTGKKFKYNGKYSATNTLGMKDSTVTDPNDDALNRLMAKEVDAIWIYAAQANDYKCDANGKSVASGNTASWNCDNWAKLGKANGYAYIHTGLMEHAKGGTTLSISKKGSGTAAILNPCIAKFLPTKDYYDLCVKHGLTAKCITAGNSHFGTSTATTPMWEKTTEKLTGDCSTGYCKCPA